MWPQHASHLSHVSHCRAHMLADLDRKVNESGLHVRSIHLRCLCDHRRSTPRSCCLDYHIRNRYRYESPTPDRHLAPACSLATNRPPPQCSGRLSPVPPRRQFDPQWRLLPQNVDFVRRPARTVSLQLPVEVPQHARQHRPHLGICQVLAQAVARPEAERLERCAVIVAVRRGRRVEPAVRCEGLRAGEVGA